MGHGRGLLTGGAALALLLCALPSAGAGPSTRRELRDLVDWVVKMGTRDTMRNFRAAAIGLTDENAPVKVLWLDSDRVPDGRRRAFAVPYNWDGKRAKPVAIALLLIDGRSATPKGTLVSGRTFLAKLDGKLVSVTAVDRELTATGEEISYAASPHIAGLPEDRRDFRRELDFWLHTFDRATWKLGR